MKNYLLACLMSAICITMYSINPALADTKELSSDIINTIENDESEFICNELNLEAIYKSTTSSAIEIDYESTTSSGIEKSNDNLNSNDYITEVVSLNAEITGEPYVGNYISVKVIGYDSNGSKVELEEEKIQYTWETADGDVLGTEKELFIDDSMKNISIACQVAYNL